MRGLCGENGMRKRGETIQSNVVNPVGSQKGEQEQEPTLLSTRRFSGNIPRFYTVRQISYLGDIQYQHI